MRFRLSCTTFDRMEVESRIKSFISYHQLLPSEAKVLVALSGGADSVALLRILLRLGYRCHAVHCNFHLRGDESNRDECFVTELCSSLQVPCEVIHFDTQNYASQHHLSIEMAARELRYREFERLRQTYGLAVVAVAHHQDDAVETMLLNLIRGAGINGLTGMKVKNGHVVRPLLCISREEVLCYLDSLGQSYVTDSTNLTDAYARNKVRLQLVPLMQQINSAAKENILQAATRLADAATIYNRVIAENKDKILMNTEEELTISIEALLATETPHAQLFELLYPYGFNSSQIVDIYRALSGEPGRVFYSKEYMLLRDRTSLILRSNDRDNAADTTLYTLPYEGSLSLPDGTVLTVQRIAPDAEWTVPRDSSVCVLSAARLNLPLTVRHPKEGDRIHPFGMKGTKLLSDLYTDRKLSRIAKQQQWLLCHGEEIVWAIGLRTSERYRLDGDEDEVLVITVQHSSSL